MTLADRVWEYFRQVLDVKPLSDRRTVDPLTTPAHRAHQSDSYRVSKPHFAHHLLTKLARPRAAKQRSGKTLSLV